MIKRTVLKTTLFALTAAVVSMSFNMAVGQKTRDFKLGVALYSFHKQKFPDAIKMAGQSGVSFVEGFSFNNMGESFGNKSMIDASDADIRRIAQLLTEQKVSMTSMYVGNGKDAADWKRIFEQGRKFGVKYLVCEPAAAHLDIIDSLAGIYKIKVAIHEHKKGESLYWHPDSVLAAVKGRSNLGACADIGHWVRSGLDPVECIKKLDGHIIGLHMKDVNNAGEDVDPGNGAIDFGRLFSELKRQQFNGFAQIECEHNMDQNLPEVKKAAAFYRKELSKVKF